MYFANQQTLFQKLHCYCTEQSEFRPEHVRVKRASGVNEVQCRGFPFPRVRSPKDDPGVSHGGTSQEAELHGDGNREIAVRTLIFKNAKLQEARGQIGSTAPLLGPWGTSTTSSNHTYTRRVHYRS